MPVIRADVSCPIYDSFRVQQVAGMFDVPAAQRSQSSYAVEVPAVDEDWTIGLIVGPSASGKTTIARRAFAEHLATDAPWPGDRAVVDCFGDLPARQITGLLTAVGFSSPPAWIRPYHVLSGGERFRCDLARSLAIGLTQRQRDPQSGPPIVVFDEFTSVVDRNVAQVGSAAVAKSIRGGTIPCRFVAVTCHYDVAEWLEPDWVVDMLDGTCQRRRLRRPEIQLELYRVHRKLWTVFAPHHYLTGKLSGTARCFAAWWPSARAPFGSEPQGRGQAEGQGNPVSFCATIPMIGRRNHWRITRMVTLPDYQGVGIGMRVAEAVCELHREWGHRINVTASHPAVLAHCRKSPRWRTARVLATGSGDVSKFISNYRSSSGRAVVSFEFVGDR